MLLTEQQLKEIRERVEARPVRASDEKWDGRTLKRICIDLPALLAHIDEQAERIAVLEKDTETWELKARKLEGILNDLVKEGGNNAEND